MEPATGYTCVVVLMEQMIKGLDSLSGAPGQWFAEADDAAFCKLSDIADY